MSWFSQMGHALSVRAPAMISRLVTAALIVLCGLVIARVVSRAASRTVSRYGRGQTLAPLAESLARFVLLATASVMALDQLGVNVATVIAGAGILGLAVGFGAQTLVKDCISGFFLIFEDVLSVGDVAKVGDITGTVERVGLRTTQVRAFNGQLFYLPNGTITQVGNFNRGFCRAIVDVGVAYEQDVATALQVMSEVGAQYAKERGDVVLEPPEAQGILSFNASDLTLRLVLKVKAQEHWTVERELRTRLKQAFEAKGVEVPYPHQVVVHKNEAKA